VGSKDEGEGEAEEVLQIAAADVKDAEAEVLLEALEDPQGRFGAKLVFFQSNNLKVAAAANQVAEHGSGLFVLQPIAREIQVSHRKAGVQQGSTGCVIARFSYCGFRNRTGKGMRSAYRYMRCS